MNKKPAVDPQGRVDVMMRRSGELLLDYLDTSIGLPRGTSKQVLGSDVERAVRRLAPKLQKGVNLAGLGPQR